jgi:hypothetical protein
MRREGGRHTLERRRRNLKFSNLERESSKDNEMFVTQTTYIPLACKYDFDLKWYYPATDDQTRA